MKTKTTNDKNNYCQFCSRSDSLSSKNKKIVEFFNNESTQEKTLILTQT